MRVSPYSHKTTNIQALLIPPALLGDLRHNSAFFRSSWTLAASLRDGLAGQWQTTTHVPTIPMWCTLGISISFLAHKNPRKQIHLQMKEKKPIPIVKGNQTYSWVSHRVTANFSPNIQNSNTLIITPNFCSIYSLAEKCHRHDFSQVHPPLTQLYPVCWEFFIVIPCLWHTKLKGINVPDFTCGDRMWKKSGIDLMNVQMVVIHQTRQKTQGRFPFLFLLLWTKNYRFTQDW